MVFDSRGWLDSKTENREADTAPDCPCTENSREEDTGIHEECGVMGVYDLDGGDVASTVYYGLFALQHRGQESCGIAVSDTNGPKKKYPGS